MYALVLPIQVAEKEKLGPNKFLLLMCFDFIFMIDKIIELFIGVIDKTGCPEKSVTNVIMKNFSSSFWLELLYIWGPFLFLDDLTDGLQIFLFKFPRFNRLFERDTAI